MQFVPEMVNMDTLRHALNNIYKDAKKEGLQVYIRKGSELADISRMRTSFVTFKDGVLASVTGVPLFESNHRMRLHRYTKLIRVSALILFLALPFFPALLAGFFLLLFPSSQSLENPLKTQPTHTLLSGSCICRC